MDTEKITLRQRVVNGLARLSAPARILVTVVSVLLLGAVLFFLFSEAIYYLLARSYVEEIANAFDLSKHQADALVWASFAAIVFFAGYALSFSKRKRLIGSLALLGLLIGHSLILSRSDNLMTKCYVLTRDSIKIMNRVGIDPQTGRECRVLTPQMAEKVIEYQNGKRPALIKSLPVLFFSPISGEALVWFTKSSPDGIELFDLMGYNPRTSEELLPVTRHIADEWTRDQLARQQERDRKPPKPINPETAIFFDPISGQPKVWYWRSDAGAWEFYDNRGFHPRSGDELQVVTRDALTRWQQETAAAKQRQKDSEDQARRKAEADRAAAQFAANERDRLAREKADADLAAQQAAEKTRKELMQAGDDCDRLAANPTDTRRAGDGVAFELLKLQADEAIGVCTRAVGQFPAELRYQYQLGRALEFRDRKKAFDIETALTKQRYPAAFDNVGWMYYLDRKDPGTAVQQFKMGAQLGDADSMVSLAEMIDRNLFAPPNSYDMKLALWRKAAELGHAGAAKALELETAKIQQKQNEQLTQQQAQQLMIQMIGGIVAGMARQ
jgi:signal transduction histidine kinase